MASFMDNLTELIVGRALSESYRRNQIEKQIAASAERLRDEGLLDPSPSYSKSASTASLGSHAFSPSSSSLTSISIVPRPIFHRSHSELLPKKNELVDPGLNSGYDISAHSLTEDQKRRIYDSSATWNVRSGDAPPLGPMKGFGVYRRSAACGAEEEFERFNERFARTGLSVQPLADPVVGDLHPETIRRLSFSSAASATSTKPNAYNKIDIVEEDTKNLFFSQQVGFQVRFAKVPLSFTASSFRSQARTLSTDSTVSSCSSMYQADSAVGAISSPLRRSSARYDCGTLDLITERPVALPRRPIFMRQVTFSDDYEEAAVEDDDSFTNLPNEQDLQRRFEANQRQDCMIQTSRVKRMSKLPHLDRPKTTIRSSKHKLQSAETQYRTIPKRSASSKLLPKKVESEASVDGMVLQGMRLVPLPTANQATEDVVHKENVNYKPAESDQPIAQPTTDHATKGIVHQDVFKSCLCVTRKEVMEYDSNGTTVVGTQIGNDEQTGDKKSGTDLGESECPARDITSIKSAIYIPSLDESHCRPQAPARFASACSCCIKEKMENFHRTAVAA